tara:strand:+ start:593 stop:1723 length:1131 start_codon:yes stop_codon:yes gene_type:complete
MKKYIGILTLLITILISIILIKGKSEVILEKQETIVPLVSVQSLINQDVYASIQSQGLVMPSLELPLISEINAQVNWLSDNMKAGASFKKGDTLIRFDKRDYELALISANSNVFNAEVNLERELAESDMANKEWARIGKGEASALTLRKPQLAQAKAILEAAKAQAEQAKRNIERTSIIAPFNGRVRKNNIDIWSTVFIGTPLGLIYSTDYYEIRLPITDQDIRFTGLRFDGKTISEENQLDVEIKSITLQQSNIWNGKIIRTEAETDPQTKMMVLVAKINLSSNRKNLLTIGQFVNATIKGVRQAEIVKIRRSLVRDNAVWIVDKSNKLRKRNIILWRYENDMAFIKEGIFFDDKLLTSRLSTLVNGMNVKIKSE